MRKKLPLGKLPYRVLLEKVLGNIEVNESILLPPSYGEDGSVIKINNELIIAAADPITGTSREAGWLAVHVNANDIAVHAADPMWFLVTLLFPKGSDENKIEEIMKGIKKGLMEIGAYLIGGHTEITDRVTDVIIAGSMIGKPMIPGKYVSSSGAKPGDVILLTKGAGLEGTLILAMDFREKF